MPRFRFSLCWGAHSHLYKCKWTLKPWVAAEGHNYSVNLVTTSHCYDSGQEGKLWEFCCFICGNPHTDENKGQTAMFYVQAGELEMYFFIQFSVLRQNLFLNYSCQITLTCSKKGINFLDTDNQIAGILPLQSLCLSFHPTSQTHPGITRIQDFFPLSSYGQLMRKQGNWSLLSEWRLSF